MTNWQRELNLVNIWFEFKAGNLTVNDSALKIAKALERLKPFNNEDLDYEKQGIVDSFMNLAFDNEAKVECIDSLMNELYDWANNKITLNIDGQIEEFLK